ncbi:hypothetical protein LB503_008291 [Fusarium chuoi]|nr:hypothetical protein LB503_008291 [Fusarium chuoi]
MLSWRADRDRVHQSAISNLVDFFHCGYGRLVSGPKGSQSGDIMRYGVDSSVFVYFSEIFHVFVLFFPYDILCQ